MTRVEPAREAYTATARELCLLGRDLQPCAEDSRDHQPDGAMTCCSR